MNDRICERCAQPCDAFDGHANFSDRGDGICVRCGRTRGWHAGTSCFCRHSTGMPAPVPISEQLELFGVAA